MDIYYTNFKLIKPLIVTIKEEHPPIEYGIYPAFLKASENQISLKIQHHLSVVVGNRKCGFSVISRYSCIDDNIGITFSKRDSLTVYLKRPDIKNQLCDLLLVSYGQLLCSFRQRLNNTPFGKVAIPLQSRQDIEEKYNEFFSIPHY